MNYKKVRETIGMLDSMVTKNEKHSDTSKQIVVDALKELKKAASEKRPKEKVMTFEELMDNQTQVVLDRLIKEGFTGVRSALYLCYNSTLNWENTVNKINNKRKK